MYLCLLVEYSRMLFTRPFTNCFKVSMILFIFYYVFMHNYVDSKQFLASSFDKYFPTLKFRIFPQICALSPHNFENIYHPNQKQHYR